MFNCKKSVHLLRDFLEGEMAPEESSALEDHLSACPPCLDFLKTYRATTGLCKRLLVSKMPDALSDKLTEFLRKKCKKE